MRIEHEQEEKKGRFFIHENEIAMGEIDYNIKDGKLQITHTEVADEFSGRNIGKALVEHAVDYAREHHLKVIPSCSFAKSLISKRPDLQDVLA